MTTGSQASTATTAPAGVHTMTTNAAATTTSQSASSATLPELPPHRPPAEKTLTKVMPQSQPAVPPVPLWWTPPSQAQPSPNNGARMQDATMTPAQAQAQAVAATPADDLDKSDVYNILLRTHQEMGIESHTKEEMQALEAQYHGMYTSQDDHRHDILPDESA